MSNNKPSSVDELCNSFYEESIDESNIPREHYEYEIKQLMIEFALYYEQTYKKNMMTNDKQSSVEWFIQQLEEKGGAWENVSIRKLNISIDVSDYMELKQQAKSMHKDETIKAFDFGDYCIDLPDGTWEQKYKSAEQYYNETFGGNDEQ